MIYPIIIDGFPVWEIRFALIRRQRIVGISLFYGPFLYRYLQAASCHLPIPLQESGLPIFNPALWNVILGSLEGRIGEVDIWVFDRKLLSEL